MLSPILEIENKTGALFVENGFTGVDIEIFDPEDGNKSCSMSLTFKETKKLATMLNGLIQVEEAHKMVTE